LTGFELSFLKITIHCLLSVSSFFFIFLGEQTHTIQVINSLNSRGQNNSLFPISIKLCTNFLFRLLSYFLQIWTSVMSRAIV